FTVEDTGPGVSEAKRARIFEAFAYADPAHARLGGAGLGLAIARQLAVAMGGEVGVDPREGGGSCFWLEAPFRSGAEPVFSPPLAGRNVGVASANPLVPDAAGRHVEARRAEA